MSTFTLPPRGKLLLEESASLAETLVSEVIASIVREERSGDLIVESGPDARKIMFDRGSVGFASSNVDELRFGNQLVASGRITKPQLDLALDVVKRDGGRIGEALVASGLLSQEDTEVQLARQIRGIATSMYGLREGTCVFHEHECRIPVELRVPVSIYRIQLEGIRQITRFDLIEQALGEPSQRLKVVETAPFRIEDRKLDPAEQRAMNGAQRGLSIEDALSDAGGERSLALRAVYGLVASGVLELGEATVERAPLEPLEVEPSPHSLPVESVLEEASPEPPQRRAASPNKEEISRLFTEIRIRKMVNDDEGVVAMLRRVVALAPENAKYAAMLAKAIARVPNNVKDAEPYFRRALSLDPDNAELHYEFGRYYQALGMGSRALAELKTALRLDPGLSKARSAVVELKQGGESLVGRSLKKLFS